MSFNLFGPATICDIKVGYISTDRGYVDGVSRYEANQYAQLNPGTQFIFKNRDKIRYLNINEVNRLSVDDLLPNTIPTSGCDDSSKNTFGLDIYNADGSFKEDAKGTPGVPRIYINGGGGVGAVANPVIGEDGSFLAVDLVDGGYGYRYPPQVSIVDLDAVGSGAVAIASLCPPDKVGTLQTFEREEDFEEYDFSNCAPPITNFGRRFGADGEDLGEWDPSLYASLRVDPIRREIIAYQTFLESIRNGWWDTRKAKPIEIHGQNKKSIVKYDVQHWAWGGSRTVKNIPRKKEKLKQVEFKVYTQGGNQVDRNLMFTFVEKNGGHKFKIKAASFPDNKVVKIKIDVKPNTIYTVNASGRYKGRGVEQGLINSFGRKPKERNKFTDGNKIFADFVKSGNDNDDLQIEVTQGKFKTDNRRKIDGHSTFDLTYQLEDSGQFKPDTKVVKKIDDSFMNSYAISPVPPSNVPGSDFAGIQYSIVYAENFPYDGEYVFKAMADNVGEVYIDNESIFQFRKFKGGPDVAKKFVKAGVHKIRCDVINNPRKERIKAPQSTGKVPVEFRVYGQGSKSHQLIRYTFTSEDGRDSFTFKPEKTTSKRYSYSRTVNVLPGVNYNVKAVSSGRASSGEKEYNIEIAEPGTKGRGPRAQIVPGGVSNKEIQYTDADFQNDTDSRFSIESTDPGTSAKFSPDGSKLIVKGNGRVTLRLGWSESPSSNGQAVGELKVAGKTFRQTNARKGEQIETIKLSKVVENVKLEQGTLKRGSFTKGGKGLESSGKSDIIFADIITSANDNDDMQIRCGSGEFTPSNKRRVFGDKGRSTYDLKFRVEGVAPEKETGRSTQSTGDKPEVVFNTLDYINKADRKLWKINPDAGRDSDFLNRFGVLPFNPAAVEREEVPVPVKSPPQPKPKASIIKRGDELFLKVTGGGRVKVDFRLKVDDNLVTSGVFAREIVIKTDDNDLKLKRDLRVVRYRKGTGLSGKEKETITGSGTFTGGKTYRIKVLGGSPTSGFKSIDKTTVGFDDDIKNGYDENGLLKITNVKILQELDARYETKQNQVIKVVKKYPQKPNASTDSYAGVHVIRWEHVDFPVDGNYTITSMVDDNATIFIGNREGRGKKAIGNGLRSVEKGGDEVIIEKQGFAQGASTGKSNDVRFFKKGKYRIRVELEQIPGKPLAKGNPMAIAIQIKTPRPEVQEVTTTRSWNQNPMGIALKIDPPLPPIPQEPIPKAPGRCPNNPIWSTRFPGGEKTWWPVTHRFSDGSKSWSKFMNRFAVSPIPPLATKGTAQGGIIFSNSWDLDAPYDGTYGMKGTVDNGGRILVDGKVILQGGYFPEANFIGSNKTLENFRSEFPQTVKFPLTKGKHTITVEVENRAQTKQKRIQKTIFNTADWAVEQSIPVTQNNDYDVVYIDLHPRNKKLNVSGDRKTVRMLDGGGNDTNATLRILSGDATFSANGRKISGKGNIKVRLEWNDDPNNKGIAISGVIINGVKLTRSSVSRTGTKTFPIQVAAPGTKNRGPRAQIVPGGVSNKEIEFTDADFQNDTDARFSIQSTSPGVSAKFSPDGKQLIVKGNGNVTLRLGWSESPSSNGQAVGELKVAGETFRQTRIRKGEQIKTIKFGSNTVNQLSKRGDDTKNIDLGAKPVSGRGLSGGTTKRGVKYSGPELASYRKGKLGPFLTPRFESDRDYLANFIGTKWIMKWEDVNFPFTGRYRIRCEADDNLRVKIDNEYVSAVEVEEGVKEFFFTANEGKRKVVMELSNADIQQPFRINPTVFNAIIDIDANISVPRERSWRKNPVGISAILIPPPCPLETKGVGKVCEIIPLEPGNGYKTPPGPGYPVVLEIIRLIPTTGGSNYGPDDKICIIKEDGSKICFDPNLTEFGSNLPVDTPPIITTGYPNIFQSSSTGVNSRFRPVIRVRRDPLDVDPDEILQVTDLVGLKRTGYVDGREYFGAVFYKDGVRFAGYYETPGQLIQVYDTLQESIDGEVTTRPSAILRQGTDITSNDPRLNIPGTPDNLT